MSNCVTELPAAKRQKLVMHSKSTQASFVTLKLKIGGTQQKNSSQQNCESLQNPASVPEGSQASAQEVHAETVAEPDMAQDIAASMAAAQSINGNYNRVKSTHKNLEVIWTASLPLAIASFVLSTTILDSALMQMKTLVSDMNQFFQKNQTVQVHRLALKKFREGAEALRETLEKIMRPVLVEHKAGMEYDAAVLGFESLGKKKRIVEEALLTVRSLQDL